jgi:hypothetical protein
MSDKDDLTPKINSGERHYEISNKNVQQNNLNNLITDNNKNRLLYVDDNTSSNTHKLHERQANSSKSEESLK